MAIFYKPFPVIGIVLCAVFLLFAKTSYSAQSLFVIEDLEIDITASSALDAKEQAFAQAQREAFNILVQRMLTNEEILQLPESDLNIISSLIKDFEVTKEKLSHVRYVGTYTIRFKEKGIRQYFIQQGFGFSDIRSRPILILPLYRRGMETVLWSYDNEWLKAWNRTGNLEGLVPIVVPMGDLDDVKDIGDDDALTYNEKSMSNMLKRYEAGETVIVIAAPDSNFELMGLQDPSATKGLSIQIYRTDRNGPEFVQELSVYAKDGQSRSEVFDEAVYSVSKALQRNWKTKARVSLEQDNQINAHIPIKSLKEWADTQKALKSITVISELVVKSLSPKGALIDIKFQGSDSRLRSALRQANITLNAPRTPESDLHYGLEIYNEPLVYELYLNRYSPSKEPKPYESP